MLHVATMLIVRNEQLCNMLYSTVSNRYNVELHEFSVAHISISSTRRILYFIWRKRHEHELTKPSFPLDPDNVLYSYLILPSGLLQPPLGFSQLLCIQVHIHGAYICPSMLQLIWSLRSSAWGCLRLWPNHPPPPSAFVTCSGWLAGWH